MNRFKVLVLVSATAGLTAVMGGGVMADAIPSFDVRSSCNAAKTYNVMEDQEKTFQGCLQDEDRARGLIRRNWSKFKTKDRVDCITEVTRVAPSYVEILTCLEMSDETGALLSRDVNQPTGQAAPPAKQPDPLSNEPLPSR